MYLGDMYQARLTAGTANGQPIHSPPVSTVVSVRALRKSYGEFEAVKGLDFELRTGEVFGLLGPNGAGKTTTVEILEGYRKRDAGEVEVLGADPAKAGRDWRERIGVVLQSSAMYENLTVAESLAHFGGYYDHPRPVDEVVELIGLAEKRNDRVRRLSGGQRRRLDLGLALVGDPELIFLDEPTTGFDPGARRRAWETIRSLSSLGKTILLTTHYLDEVEHLADRVAVLREGRIVASGTPQELTTTTPATEIRYRENGREVVLQTEEPTRVLHELTERALARDEELEGLQVRRASLEEVYLSLTQEEEAEEEAAAE
jgi:ABC-2 type transport system ATP-binding protein